jgi:hypothetical protein
MLLSVGYTLPYDRPGVIFSLSQVQNFLGDESDSAPLQTPFLKKGANMNITTFKLWFKSMFNASYMKKRALYVKLFFINATKYKQVVFFTSIQNT